MVTARALLIGCVGLALLAAEVCPAWAQGAPTPAPAPPVQTAPAQPRRPAPAQPRTVGGLFGGRRAPDPQNPDHPSQQLSLTLDVGGGNDRTLGPVDESLEGADVQQAGQIFAGQGELLHRWGTSKNYLESNARANTSYADVGITQRTSADGTIQAVAALGRRAGLSVGVGAAYEPTYLFNAFAPLAAQLEDGIVPGSMLTEGFTEQQWLSRNATSSLHRNWTPRQRTDVSYDRRFRKPITGDGLESHYQSAGLQHDWSFRETAGLRFGYSYDEHREPGLPEPLGSLHTNRANVRLRLERRLARNRDVSVTFGGGATQSRTHAINGQEPFEFVVPSGSFSAHLNFSSAWSLSTDLSRDVTILEGLTPMPFTTDAVALRTEGAFGRRVRLLLNGAYSHGAASIGANGSFETMIGSAETQYAFGRCCSLTATYSYYSHDLFDLATVQSGFPPHFERNSLRLGMSFWLPLYGSF